MELETLNKLYLELSQFATAKTGKEIELEERTQDLEVATFKLRNLIYSVSKESISLDEAREEIENIWDRIYPIPF